MIGYIWNLFANSWILLSGDEETWTKFANYRLQSRKKMQHFSPFLMCDALSTNFHKVGFEASHTARNIFTFLVDFYGQHLQLPFACGPYGPEGGLQVLYCNTLYYVYIVKLVALY